jgi:cob(I)alamin adenosyltransferase
MTGRNPSDKLKKRADYLTEMNAVKHPFDNGITARKGIEY